MSKKFNNKILLIVFAALLALWLLTQMFDSGKNERNFRTDLVEVDTAQITSVLLNPKEDTGTIQLAKNNGQWLVQKGEVTAQADPQAVESLLNALVSLKPERLAARSRDKWNDFEVTDSLGTRVKVMSQDQVVSDLLVGKLSFQQMAAQQQMPMQQTRPQATSYVRLAEEDEVYAVDGFLATTFNRPFNSWRDRSFLQLEEDSIRKISFTYPADSGFVAVKADSIWKIGDAFADSTRLTNYLSRLSSLNSTEFVDTFSAEGKQPQYTATIEGHNFQPVTVEGYSVDSVFVLRTTRKPDVFIRSDSVGLFTQVFVGKEALLPEAD